MGKVLMLFVAFFAVLAAATPAIAKTTLKNGASGCAAERSVDKWFECIGKMGVDHELEIGELPRQNFRYRMEVRTQCDAGLLSDEQYAKCLNQFIKSTNALAKASCWKLPEPDDFNKCMGLASEPENSRAVSGSF